MSICPCQYEDDNGINMCSIDNLECPFGDEGWFECDLDKSLGDWR